MKKNDDVKILILDEEVYSKEAISLAAYIYSDKADMDYKKKSGKIEVKFVAKESNNGNISDAFINEVLNQQCRIDLTKKNFRISQIIITKALLSARKDML